MKIEILGAGCPKCRMLEQNARAAIEKSGQNADIVKVENIKDIIEYGVFSTPAIVLDGKIMSAGKVNDVDEIAGWLK
jgi:small redox-active disulfide protein 2